MSEKVGGMLQPYIKIHEHLSVVRCTGKPTSMYRMQQLLSLIIIC